VPPLQWSTVTWDAFVDELRGFRARFYDGRSDDEHAYLRVRELLAGRSSSAQVADVAAEIVWFLNRWACRLPTLPATEGIAAWIREHRRTLDEQADSDILDPRVERRRATYTRLHDSLLALKRRGVPNMSDAAASKVLHQLQPELFVMWDKNIKPYAPIYGDFLAQMHRFDARLHDQAPAAARADLGEFLSHQLEYPVRKPLAKFLDEYNWYVAFGAERIRR
jgi:hypothetical protein